MLLGAASGAAAAQALFGDHPAGRQLLCVAIGALVTEITDAGLRHLEGLSQMHHLDAEHTNTTPAGIRRLEEIWQQQRDASSDMR